MKLNLIGKRFGKLTVLEKSIQKNIRRSVKWLCQCDCGNTKIIEARYLTGGHSISCGCFNTRGGNLIGERFGRLLVLDYSNERYGHNKKWLCICDCGNKKVVLGVLLKRGSTKSCGCLAKELLLKRITTHGKSNTVEFHTWSAVIARCTNPNIEGYKHYGGRGIQVCERWMNSFENFFEDMGKRPTSKHSIERRNTNGNYEPDNCSWDIQYVQDRNKRNNVYFTYNGVSYIKRDWERILKLPFGTISSYSKRGRSFEYIYNKFRHNITEVLSVSQY